MQDIPNEHLEFMVFREDLDSIYKEVFVSFS